MPNETANKSRVLERKMSKQRRIMRLVLLLLPIPLALLALTSMVFAIQSIKAPLEIEQVVATQVLEQEVVFDYTATPRISTLYPTRAQLGRQTTYLVNLLDQFTVHIKGQVKAPTDMKLEGAHQVTMRVEAGNVWAKDYVLSPEKPFSGVGEFVALDLSLVLPLRDVMSFGEQVSKEAGVATGVYKLTLFPYMKTKTVGDGPALTNEFMPSFAFELSGPLLTPRGVPPQGSYYEEYDPSQDLVQSHSVSQPIIELVPNSFSVLGRSIPVPTARILSTSVTLLSSCLALFLLVSNNKNRVRLTEAELIKKRYGGRIIEVKAGSLDLGKQRLQSGSFQALLSLADERDRSIFCTGQIDGVPSTNTYYLIDGDIVYFYTMPGGSEIQCWNTPLPPRKGGPIKPYGYTAIYRGP